MGDPTPHPPMTPGSPYVVVGQLLQDLHIYLVLEGFSLQGALKDLVSELVDRARPLGWVVAHVLEHGWGAVKEGLLAEGERWPGRQEATSPQGLPPARVVLGSGYSLRK